MQLSGEVVSEPVSGFRCIGFATWIIFKLINKAVIFMFDRKSSKSIPDNSFVPPSSPASEPMASSPKPSVPPTARSTAMIGSTVKILGEIISEENLVIEGEVEGTITLHDNELTVGHSGRIHANINAKAIKIDGLVDGDINGKEKVVITKSGNVRGNIVSPRVILEDGGQFKGSIDMGPGIAATGSKKESSTAELASVAKPTKTEAPIQAALNTN